ncbi:hypothetical protein Bbelb_099100 [Branchiostoma belcheri]|nr:hypothetical protein Bbelb_099100 [Branchiostoma belcheri]
MDSTKPEFYSQNSSLQHDLGVELLQQYMRWEEGDTVLDAGCGTGEICKYISQQPGVASVWGLDVSPDFVSDIVKERHSSHLLEECGFEVLSCHLKKLQYSFTCQEQWKKSMSALLRHLCYIPEDKHEEFLNDAEKMARDVRLLYPSTPGWSEESRVKCLSQGYNIGAHVQTCPGYDSESNPGLPGS